MPDSVRGGHHPFDAHADETTGGYIWRDVSVFNLAVKIMAAIFFWRIDPHVLLDLVPGYARDEIEENARERFGRSWTWIELVEHHIGETQKWWYWPRCIVFKYLTPLEQSMKGVQITLTEYDVVKDKLVELTGHVSWLRLVGTLADYKSYGLNAVRDHLQLKFLGRFLSNPFVGLRHVPEGNRPHNNNKEVMVYQDVRRTVGNLERFVKAFTTVHRAVLGKSVTGDGLEDYARRLSLLLPRDGVDESEGFDRIRDVLIRASKASQDALDTTAVLQEILRGHETPASQPPRAKTHHGTAFLIWRWPARQPKGTAVVLGPRDPEDDLDSLLHFIPGFLTRIPAIWPSWPNWKVQSWPTLWLLPSALLESMVAVTVKIVTLGTFPLQRAQSSVRHLVVPASIERYLRDRAPDLTFEWRPGGELWQSTGDDWRLVGRNVCLDRPIERTGPLAEIAFVEAPAPDAVLGKPTGTLIVHDIKTPCRRTGRSLTLVHKDAIWSTDVDYAVTEGRWKESWFPPLRSLLNVLGGFFSSKFEEGATEERIFHQRAAEATEMHTATATIQTTVDYKSRGFPGTRTWEAYARDGQREFVFPRTVLLELDIVDSSSALPRDASIDLEALEARRKLRLKDEWTTEIEFSGFTVLSWAGDNIFCWAAVECPDEERTYPDLVQNAIDLARALMSVTARYGYVARAFIHVGPLVFQVDRDDHLTGHSSVINTTAHAESKTDVGRIGISEEALQVIHPAEIARSEDISGFTRVTRWFMKTTPSGDTPSIRAALLNAPDDVWERGEINPSILEELLEAPTSTTTRTTTATLASGSWSARELGTHVPLAPEVTFGAWGLVEKDGCVPGAGTTGEFRVLDVLLQLEEIDEAHIAPISGDAESPVRTGTSSNLEINPDLENELLDSGRREPEDDS